MLSFRPSVLAWVAAVMPVVVVHACLALVIHAAVFPACYPVFDGCASISATGRTEPSVYLFKPMFTIQALLLIVIWLCNMHWLALLAGEHQSAWRTRWPRAAIGFLGLSASVALIVYVTFLGSDSAIYQFMRRFGIYGYFLGTVLAHILLAREIRGVARRADLPSAKLLQRYGWYLLLLALAPFMLGLVNLVLKAALESPDRAENLIEWWAAALMQAGVFINGLCWRATGYRGHYHATLRSG